LVSDNLMLYSISLNTTIGIDELNIDSHRISNIFRINTTVIKENDHRSGKQLIMA